MGLIPTIPGSCISCASGRSRRTWGLRRRPGTRRAFSLLELLIVLGVATTLLALLFPGLNKVRESARRVFCGRNMYQIGIGLEAFANENDWHYPGSYFVGYGNDHPQPQHMMALHSGRNRSSWDGIGLLLPDRFINDPKVYYCPSHTGKHPYERYAAMIANPGGEERIFGNYHYRGLLPNNRPNQPRDISRTQITQLAIRFPKGISLLSDGLRTRSDFNHIVGGNRLQEDLSVSWLDDSKKRIYNILPQASDDGDGDGVGRVWRLLD